MLDKEKEKKENQRSSSKHDDNPKRQKMQQPQEALVLCLFLTPCQILTLLIEMATWLSDPNPNNPASCPSGVSVIWATCFFNAVLQVATDSEFETLHEKQKHAAVVAAALNSANSFSVLIADAVFELLNQIIVEKSFFTFIPALSSKLELVLTHIMLFSGSFILQLHLTGLWLCVSYWGKSRRPREVLWAQNNYSHVCKHVHVLQSF